MESKSTLTNPILNAAIQSMFKENQSSSIKCSSIDQKEVQKIYISDMKA